MRRDHGKCVLCSDWATEIDHIIPLSLGGTGDMDNLRALCSKHHKLETALLRDEQVAYRASMDKETV